MESVATEQTTLLVLTLIAGAEAEVLCPQRNVIGLTILGELLRAELSNRDLITGKVLVVGQLNAGVIAIDTTVPRTAAASIPEILNRVYLAKNSLIFVFDEREGIWRTVHPGTGGAMFAEPLLATLAAIADKGDAVTELLGQIFKSQNG